MVKDNPKSELARRFRLQMCDPEYPIIKAFNTRRAYAVDRTGF